jgi:hypothetical protein
MYWDAIIVKRLSDYRLYVEIKDDRNLAATDTSPQALAHYEERNHASANRILF